LSKAHLITFANEKGGSGKSTTAVHVAVALSFAGRRVAAIDLDTRQRTLGRYLENRIATERRSGLTLPTPAFETFDPGRGHRLGDLIDAFAADHEIIVIDTPGRDDEYARAAITRADTLVTPINDSFVDLDLLARVDPETLRIVGPSRYSEMVWEQKKRRLMRDGGAIDWIVMRNRLGHLDARNKREVARVLDELMKRLRCRLVPGFGERVIFRELFLRGLTLFDLEDVGMTLTMSHIAARQEVRALMTAVGLPPGAVPAAGADDSVSGPVSA